MRLAALLLILLPTYAMAQPTTSDPQQMHNDDCARARKQGKPCVLDMAAEVIEDGVSKPDTMLVDARIFSKHNSLIRIRKDFIAEILKSANDID
jgi:hypothetical protein